MIRPYVEADAFAVSSDIRAIDRIECEAMAGEKPSGAFLHSLASRSVNMTTVVIGGDVVAIYGVIRPYLLTREGNPWLLGTTGLDTPAARRAFLALGRSELFRIAADFSMIWNAAAEENTRTLRWLEWLGFRLLRHSVQEVRGVRFVPFVMEADDVC